jgi:predicted short-subunit dehydrogenase-like oxidoreductase (DUF2520 family)
MNSSLKIGIVGLGNLGWNLGLKLTKSGYNIHQIVTSRQPQNKEFGKLINAQILNRINDLDNDLNLIFICRSDNLIKTSIEELVAHNGLKNDCVVVHTSGSTTQFATRFIDGVFYPFQTFTAGFEANWNDVPIFTESEIETQKQVLNEIATTIGGSVKQLTDEQRKMLHITGVFSSNFPNHLIRLIFDFLRMNNLDTRLVQPLMAEAIRKGFELGPENSQTGPAIRNDIEILENHLDSLEQHPEMKEFYSLFTKGIQNL